MKNLDTRSIYRRTWLIVGLFVAGVVGGNALDFFLTRDALLEEKSIQIRRIVESERSLLTHFYALQTSGALSEQEAQARALSAIRAMRHGQDEYFWINDLSEPIPKMVMHPIYPELEGKVLDSKQFDTATAISPGDRLAFRKISPPANLFKATLEIAQNAGHGYLRYNWSKSLGDRQQSVETYPKLSYVEHFAPWGWVIGSGIYVDNLNAQISEQTTHQVFWSGALVLLVVVAGYLTARSTRQIESNIRLRQAEMQALIDSTTESVLLLSPDGKVLAINTFGAQRFRKTVGEMLQINFFDLLPPALAESRRAACQAVVRTSEPMVLRDERNGIHFENSIFPVLDDDGLTIGVAVYAKDVTEHHQTRMGDELFRQLDTLLLKWQMNVESIAQIFCDSLQPIFSVPALWIGQLGTDGKIQILASTDQTHNHFLTAETLPQFINETQPEWPPVSLALTSGNRQLAPCHVAPDNQHALRAQASRIQGCLVLPLRVQEKNWGVLVVYGTQLEQLNQNTQRLATVATRLSHAIESAVQQEWLKVITLILTDLEQAVFISNRAYQVFWSNTAFKRDTGYQPDANAPIDALDMLAPGHDIDTAHIFDTLNQGTTWQGELQLRCKNGKVCKAATTIKPIRNDLGEITYFVALLSRTAY